MNIINTAPPESGWASSSKDRRNRYWLLDGFTNPANENVRKFLYLYHRQGLDIMAQNLNEGLNNITTAIEGLQQLYLKNPSLFSISLICMAKSAEFVNVFSGAETDKKQKVVPLLKRIHPADADKYDKLLK